MPHADISMNSIAEAVPTTTRRLPRAVGLGLAAVVSIGLWLAALELVRAVF
ncbi:hypothetical protein G5B46_18780 [Caulobacter sp. 602-2]|uniref:Uncharacterized protein n=1 Tax=Caulobacter sp. 602-2 TaxID=2710887 RepID=A0A6G4R1J6_9CAUL|nr:hypothetical protein [Caulobacter sp. 602-2]NGM51662.1 hypothetical protein [Caulobacter sp. 602-2]